MRIRKNAQHLSSTISTPSPSSISLSKTHLNCQLNQSPWDIITFPPNYSDSSDYPLHFQVDEDFGFAGNESFGDSIGAIQSATGPMETRLESEEMFDNDRKSDFHLDASQVGFDEGMIENKIIKENKEVEDVLCCENDGKGWQCGRIVKKGHKTCARHLKTCKNSDGGTRRGRGRPRIKKKEPDENPNNEYYYYSGFGPLWGKKKGPGRMSDSNATSVDEHIGSSMSRVIDRDTKAAVSEIDYMECDDDDEDEDEDVGGGGGGGESGKKRGRKRIKARSLKSLM